MKQKNWKKLLVLNINPFESGTTNSHTPEQDNCHWHSMCYETPRRFNISLREIFSKSESLRLTKIYDESALLHILQEFGTLQMLTVQGCSRALFLESGLTTSLALCNFQNKVGMAIIFFFKMFKI